MTTSLQPGKFLRLYEPLKHNRISKSFRAAAARALGFARAHLWRFSGSVLPR
jgi:hypothetical protein